MRPNQTLIVYTHINFFQLITFLSFDFAKSVRFWCVVHTEAHRHTQPSLAKHTAAIFFWFPSVDCGWASAHPRSASGRTAPHIVNFAIFEEPLPTPIQFKP